MNVACTDPDLDIGEECFCMCTDTGPAARDHFDLQLFDLLGNEFMVVAGTPAGEALFANPIFRKCSPEHVARRRAILEEVRKRFKPGTTSWFSAAIQLYREERFRKKPGTRSGIAVWSAAVVPTFVRPAPASR